MNIKTRKTNVKRYLYLRYKTTNRLIRFLQRPIFKTHFYIIQFYLILPYNFLQKHSSATVSNTPFSKAVRLGGTARFALVSNDTKQTTVDMLV